METTFQRVWGFLKSSTFVMRNKRFVQNKKRFKSNPLANRLNIIKKI